MSHKFGNLNVLATGSGLCPLCKVRVARVLVEELSGSRVWHAADIGQFGYVPHRCKPSTPEHFRRAA